MIELKLYQSVARQILALIESGEFPAGSRLPGERDLAQRFGVGRIAIREAEIALEAQGRVAIRTGSGVYVLSPSADGPGNLPGVTAFELTAARAVIEAEAAALACARISDAQVEELEALVEAMARDGAGEVPGEDADRAFHLAIARASTNPAIEYCVRLLWRMRNELPEVRRVYEKVCVHDHRARANEHKRILDALRRRDPGAVRVAMRKHFQRLFEAMLRATEVEALDEVKRRTERDRQHFLVTTRI